MSNHVLVLDTDRRPLAPCRPITARKLLTANKAAVFRQYPFTIILNKKAEASTVKFCELKIDPGSKTTGLALLNGNAVVWGAELTHRGERVKASLLSRSQSRRSRRNRKTRYRPARFLNRTKPKGWLAPSLRHRVETTMTWVKRLMKFCSIGKLSQELVRFDTQKMQNPEISGAAYQQGTLAGYEVREYLLEKWGRRCVYCEFKDTPLQIEHIQPRSRGGSDRISNLTLACQLCNQAKGALDIQEFLSGRLKLAQRILAQAKAPLKDAAVVNSTRWALFNALKATGLPVVVGTGGQTKFNRTRFNLPKTHWLDAACVGEVDSIDVRTSKPLQIACNGHSTRFRTLIDQYGFPRAIMRCPPVVNGLQAGDIVRAEVPNGKYRGTWVGAIAGIRAKGSPALRPFGGKQIDLTKKTIISVLHRKDGYYYAS